MLVLHVHAMQAFGPTFFELTSSPSKILSRLLLLIPPGMHGVDIFFVLSGFLVSGLFFQELKRTGTVSIGRFLIRRGFKIYPAFWTLIAVTVLIQFVQVGHTDLKKLLAELFFVQNYVIGLWQHTWTLAVEEHFYFLLALMFFFLKRSAGRSGAWNLKIVPRVVDVVILLCFAAKSVTWFFGLSRTDLRWLVCSTHFRIDALFFGVWLAHLWYNRWDDRFKAKVLSLRWLWIALGLVLISTLSERLLNREIWYVFGYNILYLGSGFLLLAALSLNSTSTAPLKWLGWLGKHSYSVYLWHMPLLDWIKPLFPRTADEGKFLVSELIYVATAWVFGIIMARIIEIPTLRLRDKLFPAKLT